MAGLIQELLQATPCLFLQEYLSEADLVFSLKLRLCFLKLIEDSYGAVARFVVVVGGLTLETRSISSDEVFEDDTDRVASFTDADGFKHTCTSELLEHIVAVEVIRREQVVRLDAPDVSRARLSQGHNQRRELLAELIRQRVSFETG